MTLMWEKVTFSINSNSEITSPSTYNRNQIIVDFKIMTIACHCARNVAAFFLSLNSFRKDNDKSHDKNEFSMQMKGKKKL